MRPIPSPNPAHAPRAPMPWTETRSSPRTKFEDECLAYRRAVLDPALAAAQRRRFMADVAAGFWDLDLLDD